MGNLILNVDSYKLTMANQYPQGTQYVSSYIEARGGQWDDTLFFGLQIFLQKYLSKPISMEDIDEAEHFVEQHIGPDIFNRKGWEYILKTYNGYLPVLIQAVPEGTILPTSNVLVQIVNTDPKCYWLTTHLETALLRAVWYPTTVATNSLNFKRIIQKSIDLSSDVPEQISFKLHDFGARGVASSEQACIGGAAHLVNFMGSDTIEGIQCAMKYYGGKMPGFSIPAMEHSTVTSWGRENEETAYRNMLNQFPEVPMLAAVSDSYDVYNAVERIWGGQLKSKVSGHHGTVVIRPDSGDPTIVPIELIKILDKQFGSTINSKGFKVLNPKVRVIQGDSVSVDNIGTILKNLNDAGYATDNLAFGSGGALLQSLNRDTLGFAMKCSSIYINGTVSEWRDVYKDPATQSSKKSKKGRLALVKTDGKFQTIRLEELGKRYNHLETVFKDGVVTKKYTFDDVRTLASK